jgi:nucleotide-binding universal stress UspA family protein
MGIFSRILIAVDGSEPSNAAMRTALRLAAADRAELRFIAVFERDALIGRCSTDAVSGLAVGDVLDAAETECREALDTALQAAEASGLDATTIMRNGLPVDTILHEATIWDVTCIAIGTHGRSGIARAVLGSCAEGVLRRSTVPVLVAHATSDGGPIERILCAVDESPAAREAYDAAVTLAVERDAELHLLSVVQVADLYAAGFELEGFDPDGSMSTIYADARAAVKKLAAEALVHGARVKPHVLGGSDVAERIVQCATMQRCGLILLGTHGRRGLRRALLGSTAEGVLRTTTIPTVAFRDPNRESAARTPEAAALTAAT